MATEQEVLFQRQEKDRFFRQHSQSPLTPEQKPHFGGLSYYPYNPALDLTLVVEPFEPKANVKLLTTTGDTRYYLRWGLVRFEVDGQPAELTLYFSPGGDAFFIPFMDATSGSETYSAGRYAEAERLTAGRVHLDLNLAYSPYCAFNEPPALAERAGREPRVWNCPIPPQENRLKVPIRAGEMKPQGAWVIADHD
jgi:hypothetical protein